MISWGDVKEIATFFRELPSSFRAEVVEPSKRDFREMVLKKYDSRYLQAGDIIGAPYTHSEYLTPYEHYGIYIGDDEVIHFAAENEGEEKSIHKTTIGRFASKITSTFFLVDFDKFFDECRKRKALHKALLPFVSGPMLYAILSKDYQELSADTTIRRAKSRLGDAGYVLAFNNCEHFAMWCKTGVAECNQLIPFHVLNNYRVPFSLSNYK